MPSPSIAIVATYFGPLPLWMPAFLLSCRMNPDVDWIIYTDAQVPERPPRNVVFRPMDLDEFNRRSSAALAAPIAVLPSYLKKLTDLKPAYGLIFEDDLRRYDFWAYSELDIIWGDIRRFMTDRRLARYQILTARRYKLAGHFTLVKNTPETNRFFLRIPDAIDKLTQPRRLRLDEHALTDLLRDHVGSRWWPWLRTEPRVFWRQELTISADYQRAMPDGGGRLVWRRGRTYDAEGREMMYLHFHKLKAHIAAIDFGYDDEPSEFSFDRRQFQLTAAGR